MTKRAKAIQGLADQLGMLAMDGTPIKLSLSGNNKTMPVEEGRRILLQYKMNIQAHLVDLVENNDEQAEALMQELGIQWKSRPSSE